VKKALNLGCAAAALALLAGCGSSSYSASSSSSSSSSPAAASTPSTSTPASTVAASSSPASASSAVLVTTKHSKLGTILAAGPKKLTVYLFEADKGESSACTGACEKAWPPVKTGELGKAAGKAVAADLGTITRSDGTKQMTYEGHPLYFFEKDKDSGDAYGQGSKAFGAGWYVMKPNGGKVDDDDDDKGGDDDAS
jgi:predicted lipoprotein with Yx(FWY)xxD motif